MSKRKKKQARPINDGRKLEDVVALIEGTHLPPCFKLEKRQPIRDHAGFQLAELDVLITGRLGTSTWSMLIECRDRPSSGPAPRSWIQQLVGRRDDLNVNKVMAVSSTGFARGVSKYAKAKGIELRTFSDLSADAIVGSIPRFAPLVVQNSHFHNARLEFIPTSPDGAQCKSFRVPLEEPCFIDSTTNARLTFKQVWMLIVSLGDFFKGVGVGESRRQVVIVDQSTRDRLTVEHEGQMFQIGLLEFDAEFSLTASAMPLVEAKTYAADDGERLADVFKWQGQPGDEIKEMLFIGFRKKDDAGS